MFAVSGTCFVLASFAAFGAVFFGRLFDWWRAVGSALLGALLSCVGIGFFWLGSTYPTFNFRNNLGFPADWSCSTITAGHQVCGRDDSRSPAPHAPPN